MSLVSLKEGAAAAGASFKDFILIALGQQTESLEPAYKFKLGEPLIENLQSLRELPTQMRHVHEWYMANQKDHCKQQFFSVRVPPKYTRQTQNK